MRPAAIALNYSVSSCVMIALLIHVSTHLDGQPPTVCTEYLVPHLCEESIKVWSDLQTTRQDTKIKRICTSISDYRYPA